MELSKGLADGLPAIELAPEDWPTMEDVLSDKYTKDWFTEAGEAVYLKAFIDGLQLPSDFTLSEWADRNRILSPEASAEPGPWNTSRAEYQRGVMDAITDIHTTEITMMSSSQVGKNEIINNAIGYFIDKDPAPMLLVEPTDDMVEAISQDRIAPMLRDTPCLRGKVIDGERKSGNKLKHKVFPGGQLSLASAQSPSSLASRPIRIVFLDEIDRYPYSAGKEGNPADLAIKRTTTFWNKKIIRTSTPTLKGFSQIMTSYEESDQRRFYVPCPHCGEYQILYWANVKWEKDNPETAAYMCEHCGVLWNDVERWGAVKRGYWAATKEFKGHAGFWLWEGYSPWVKLSDTVDRFLKATRSGSESLKVFINTSLAECWEDKGERVDDHTLIARREDYNEIAPAEVVLITAGVDVQADRIEIDRFGWGADQQCWGLGKIKIYGDPTGDAIWEQLDEVLRTPIAHELVGEMPISATGVDSGYLTQQVGKFCRPRWGRRIWALKGVAGAGRPIWEQSPKRLKELKLKFFLVGVDQAKETIYSRLRLDDPSSAGYIHFSQLYDEEHFEQLTSEEVVTEYRKGKSARYWKLKEGHKRNEALDMLVYAYAALEGLTLMGISLRRQRQYLLKSAGITEEQLDKIKHKPQRSAELPENHEPPKPKPSPLIAHKKKRKTFRMF